MCSSDLRGIGLDVAHVCPQFRNLDPEIVIFIRWHVSTFRYFSLAHYRIHTRPEAPLLEYSESVLIVGYMRRRMEGMLGLENPILGQLIAFPDQTCRADFPCRFACAICVLIGRVC